MTWLTPIALVAAGSAAALIVWELREHPGTRALVAVRRLPALAAALDWPGAVDVYKRQPPGMRRSS